MATTERFDSQQGDDSELERLRAENRQLKGLLAEREAVRDLALLQSQERTRLIVATALDAVVEIGEDDRIISWNAHAEQIFGWTREEAIGQLLAETMIPVLYRQAHLEGMQRFQETGQGPVLNQRIEITAMHRDGHEFPVELAISPIRTAETTTFSAFVRDLSAQKQAESERLHHLREIEALNTRLRRSIQETHHRVKNNLQIIAALAEMEMETDQSLVPATALARISQHTLTLAAIYDLLTLEAKADGHIESISTKAALEKLIPLLQETTGGRHIVYQIDDFRIPVREGGSLALLISELVSNAVKHGRTDIELVLTAEEDSARLEVCDDGPGFPPEFDWSIAANTGLELIDSIIRNDLEGAISYENREQGGARVVVNFPIPAI